MTFFGVGMTSFLQSTSDISSFLLFSYVAMHFSSTCGSVATVSWGDVFMASKQQIQFWGKLLRRKRGATKSPLDESFLNAVKEYPESFELFVKYVRRATYPDFPDKDAPMERDDRILGPRISECPRCTKVGTIVSL